MTCHPGDKAKVDDLPMHVDVGLHRDPPGRTFIRSSDKQYGASANNSPALASFHWRSPLNNKHVRPIADQHRVGRFTIPFQYLRCV